jgi:hypothetical protein
MGMKKILLSFIGVLLMFFLTACEEPKEICGDGYYTYMMMPIYHSTGQTSYVTYSMMPIWNCTKYVPNPRYTGGNE